jgi:predicted O-methyltransferase YrrM
MIESIPIFEGFPELADLYNSKPFTGRTGKAFATAGGTSTLSNLLAIQAFLERERPDQTLEIGLACGASCLLIAQYHRKNGAVGARHVAIDPFQDSVWDGVARLKLESSGLESMVSILTKPSSLALPELLSDRAQMGLIYVDGSHLFEDVFVDVYYSWKLLRDGGVLLMDDSSDSHVHKVVRFIRRNLGQSLREIEVPTVSSTKKFAQKLARRQQLTAFRRYGAADRKWDAHFNDF